MSHSDTIGRGRPAGGRAAVAWPPGLGGSSHPRARPMRTSCRRPSSSPRRTSWPPKTRGRPASRRSGAAMTARPWTSTSSRSRTSSPPSGPSTRPSTRSRTRSTGSAATPPRSCGSRTRRRTRSPSRAHAQADLLMAEAQAQAEATTRDAEARRRTFDADADLIWRERTRLIDDTRKLADCMLSVADDAVGAVPARGRRAEKKKKRKRVAATNGQATETSSRGRPDAICPLDEENPAGPRPPSNRAAPEYRQLHHRQQRAAPRRGDQPVAPGVAREVAADADEEEHGRQEDGDADVLVRRAPRVLAVLEVLVGLVFERASLLFRGVPVLRHVGGPRRRVVVRQGMCRQPRVERGAVARPQPLHGEAKRVGVLRDERAEGGVERHRIEGSI